MTMTREERKALLVSLAQRPEGVTLGQATKAGVYASEAPFWVLARECEKERLIFRAHKAGHQTVFHGTREMARWREASMGTAVVCRDMLMGAK